MFDVDRMGGRSAGRLDLDTALHHVIERGEIEVHYQPLVSLADRHILGAEALVRWNHPDHGMLLQDEFIQLAEDNGTILPIGRLVLEQPAARPRWSPSSGPAAVGVNLSARQFQQVDLADDITEGVEGDGHEPSQLCLEITESLAMDDVDLTTSILTRLHTLGVRLAIDDFGRDYSSLGYLARFPIDVVKIDQSFVRDIDQGPGEVGHRLRVVALSQGHRLDDGGRRGRDGGPGSRSSRSLGCDVAQGFYFARPVSATAFSTMLTTSAGAGDPPDLRIVHGERAG